MDKEPGKMDYEAEYNRLLRELEKAKMEIEILEERWKSAWRENIELRAIKRTIEVVFGRNFDND